MKYSLFDLAVHYGVAYIKADWKRNQAASRRPSHPHPQLLENSKSKSNDDVPPDEEIINPKKKSCFHRFKTWHRRGNFQRFRRVKIGLIRVGSAVFIAGFTSFLAGASMAPSKLTAFSQMGIFLMLIMFVSWAYATWFFLPLLSFLGPTDKHFDIP